MRRFDSLESSSGLKIVDGNLNRSKICVYSIIKKELLPDVVGVK